MNGITKVVSFGKMAAPLWGRYIWGRCIWVLCLWVLCTTPVQAEKFNIAVAANFSAAMKEIAKNFNQSTGHHAVVSYGSTGKLYSQILHGAPFKVFLSADQQRAEKLQQQGLAAQRFTYAIGKLVLWSSDNKREVDRNSLQQNDFRKLALANPKVAPYGAAAIQLLKNLNLYPKLRSKLITGDSIAQTHQFVSTGNVELGFIALAQIVLDDSGSRWEVPQNLYPEIRQDAVLLNSGKDNPAAQAFLHYLKTEPARKIIRKYGYATD